MLAADRERVGARRRLRALSWWSVGAAIAAMVCVIPGMPLVVATIGLGLAVASIVLAFCARAVGRARVPSFDGRLSLAVAIVSSILVIYLVPTLWASYQLAMASL